MLTWHQYLIGIFYVLAGINHIRKPEFYQQLVPPYIPAVSTVVLLSGILEMILGLMILNKDTQVIAAWGIIGMLLLWLPVHVYILQNKKLFPKVPKWMFIIGLVFQFLLMFWAFLYT